MGLVYTGLEYNLQHSQMKKNKEKKKEVVEKQSKISAFSVELILFSFAVFPPKDILDLKAKREKKGVEAYQVSSWLLVFYVSFFLK